MIVDGKMTDVAVKVAKLTPDMVEDQEATRRRSHSQQDPLSIIHIYEPIYGPVSDPYGPVSDPCSWGQELFDATEVRIMSDLMKQRHPRVVRFLGAGSRIQAEHHLPVYGSVYGSVSDPSPSLGRLSPSFFSTGVRHRRFDRPCDMGCSTRIQI